MLQSKNKEVDTEKNNQDTVEKIKKHLATIVTKSSVYSLISFKKFNLS